MSEINHHYPPQQFYCSTCGGKRTLWSRTIARAYNPCTACGGKGYMTKEDTLVSRETLDEKLKEQFPGYPKEIVEQGRAIHMEVVQKRMGRPSRTR